MYVLDLRHWLFVPFFFLTIPVYLSRRFFSLLLDNTIVCLRTTPPRAWSIPYCSTQKKAHNKYNTKEYHPIDVPTTYISRYGPALNSYPMGATTQNARPLPSGQDDAQSPTLIGGQPIKITSLTTSSLNHHAINSTAPRRAPIPQLQSSLAFNSESYFDDDDGDSWWKNIVREQIDTQTLRDMAKFFRTTEPPSLMRASIETQRNCFGAAVNVEKKRWSLQSILRSKKALRGGSANASPEPPQFPGSAVLSTSVGGHNYFAISVPSKKGSFSSSPIVVTTTHEIRVEKNEDLTKTTSPTSPLQNEVSKKEEDSADDRTSLLARDSTLRFYGSMLRLLGPSPVEDERNKNMFNSGLINEKVEEEKYEDAMEVIKEQPVEETKAVKTPSLERRTQSPPPVPQKPEARPPPLRSTSSYSTIPRPSSRGVGKHGRAGSSATIASKSSPRREKFSPVLGSTSTMKGDSPDLPSPSDLYFPRQKNTKSPTSPRQKKPGNIVVAPKSMLQVPQQELSLLTPDSPGFPKMLAAMTFPSPPDSSSSHHGKDSFSSRMTMSSSRSETPEITNTIVSTAGLGEHVKSLPSPSISDKSQQTPTLPRHEDDNEEEDEETRFVVPERSDARGHRRGMPMTAAQKAIDSSISSKESRQSFTSVTTDTDISETTMDSRNSMMSNTTLTSNSTATENKDDHYPKGYLSHSKSRSSLDILTKKRSRWSLTLDKNNGSFSYKDESTTESGDTASRRLSRMSSVSISSASTAATATTDASLTRSSLAERRRARREKVREKIQMDLDTATAAKANKKANNRLRVNPGIAVGTAVLAHVVDSPVLGYFAGNTASVPHDSSDAKSRARLAQTNQAIHRPSPLAASSKEVLKQEDEADNASDDEFEDAISDHTVPEHEDDVISSKELDEPPTPASLSLCMSPIMVTASIEPGPRPPTPPATPTPNLAVPDAARLLSYLTSLIPLAEANGGLDMERQQAAAADKRASVIRQRPVPIKVSKQFAGQTPSGQLSAVGEEAPDSSTTQDHRQSVPGTFMSSLSSWANWETKPLNRRQSMPLAAKTSLSTSNLKDNEDAKDGKSPVLSPDDEKRWLQAHQRQSVQEWRQSALRRQQLQQSAKEGEDTSPSSRRSRVSFLNDGPMNIEAAAAAANQERLLKRRTTSSLGGWDASKLDSPVQDKEEESEAVRKTEEADNTNVEERLKRLEKSGTEWNDVVIPLLEKMSHLLSEIHKGSLTSGGQQ